MKHAAKPRGYCSHCNPDRPMTAQSLVNGKASGQISILDRGLLYGDGVFETIAVRERRIFLWHEHMQRLHSACEVLRFKFPGVTLLQNEVAKLLGTVKQNVTLRITLTRGVGKRGYRPVQNAEPNRIISVHEWLHSPQNYSKNGIHLRCCDMRLANSVLAGLKHLNRLEQVLAQAEWQAEDGIQEGLMLDHNNHVIEGTMTNVFMVKDEVLMTPDLSYAGVDGIMRRCIMNVARSHAIKTQVSKLSLDDIRHADEVFVTNSVIGIWPVQQFEEFTWPVPGEMTTRIMQLIENKQTRSGIVI